MTERATEFPLFYILLDVAGMLFLLAGILPLAGMDFGYPVLRSVAPAFIGLGILLMVPLLAWILRRVSGEKS